MSKASEPPKRLFLQWGNPGESPGSVDTSDVTWAGIRVFPGDVEYVRADLAAAATERAEKAEQQLASRDAWVRTADRLPDFGALSEITLLVWRPLMIHPITLTIPAGSKALSNYTHWRALPAPPAGDEGGDDA